MPKCLELRRQRWFKVSLDKKVTKPCLNKQTNKKWWYIFIISATMNVEVGGLRLAQAKPYLKKITKSKSGLVTWIA
jgi:hypothetical protein